MAVAVLTPVTLFLAAGPAWAHEEINPKVFPTGQPTFFTLSTANEAKANLVKVTLKAPSGVAFGATTREPSGWTVEHSDDTITWTGGAVTPDHFEQWGYEIEGADHPGTLAYKVTLGFYDGKSDDVEVDVVAAAPTDGQATSTSATTSVAAGSLSEARTAKTDQGRANAALVLAVIALALGAAAIGLATRRRPRTRADRKGPRSGPAQDW